MRAGLLCLGGAVWLCLASAEAVMGQAGSVAGVVHGPGTSPLPALVYLIPESGETPAPDPDPVIMDQRNLHFVPRTLAVPPGQEVAFRNSDPLMHNVFSPERHGDDFDLGTYPAGEWRTHVFRQTGAYVILCHIHPEMEAYVVVVPTRYHAAVDPEGKFRIEKVPYGRYVLHVWHPRAASYERSISIRGGGASQVDVQLTQRRPGPARRTLTNR